ncbi:DUF4377 domain-containing protein [Capnocytophaga sp.]|uniref:DUF4377 domain-containing protein n=1 Tax=Capnocytophaga sp. TaxID=44737 RepID=UPI0026DA986D|nr:DUF4377 domain-containing protein [Capnocytophaga sp.]MDO5105477.1 META domain-containing protein [Capnocytophaga sp.]
MKKIKNIVLVMTVMGMTSCATSSKQVYWVAGSKAECSGGAGKMQCLQVSKNPELSKANWEYFYAPIENFVFEEGFLKKIELSQTQLDPKNVPADASSIKYTMLKELEKITDPTTLLNGKWVLEKLNEETVTVQLRPELEIHLQENRINGTGGCNLYFADIEQVNPNTIHFGVVGSTRKMCFEPQIENQYFMTLEQVKQFQIEDNTLVLSDKKGKKLLTFVRKNESN